MMTNANVEKYKMKNMFFVRKKFSKICIIKDVNKMNDNTIQLAEYWDSKLYQ